MYVFTYECAYEYYVCTYIRMNVVCVCMYIYIYTHLCMYVCMCVRIMYVRVCVCVCMHTLVCEHVCIQGSSDEETAAYLQYGEVSICHIQTPGIPTCARQS
jgi:hypothetical protein